MGEENVLTKEPMKRHTTFQVGGPADYFVTPGEEGQIRDTAAILRDTDTPFYVMGNGSNLLVGDRGYRGVIIQLYKKMDGIQIQDTLVHARAGALLSRIAAKALEASLSGFEFASGIPGTLGGAMMMNAGAYGGEMKQVAVRAHVLKATGDIRKFRRKRWGLDIGPVFFPGTATLYSVRIYN